MKEIDRYDIVIDGDRTRSIDSERGYWCKYYEVEQLKNRIKELEAELKQVGDYLMLVTNEKNDEVQRAFEFEQKIKELESDKHINEIKAQGICWALELASFDCVVHDNPVSVLEKVEKYAEQLRNNNE